MNKRSLVFLYFIFVCPAIADGPHTAAATDQLNGLFKSNPSYSLDQSAPDPVNFAVTDLSNGMYSFQSANQIPNNAANFIQNFYTDIEGVGIERNGSVKKEATVLGNPSAVTGLWSFLDVNGTEWLIAFSSRTFYKEQNGGTFASFGPQTTVAQIPVATNNLGKIWFVDGIDKLWWFDGTSTGSVVSAPLGKLITSWRNRIVIGNVSGSQSTLYFSADGDGTNWTLGGGGSDPFNQPVGGANDGYAISCLYGMYQDTLIIGRKFDMWGTYGFSQLDQQTRKLTSEIGCIQNGTMKETDGDLIWLSARGLERLNGSAIQLISDPIRDITDVLVKNTANQRSLTQQAAADWGAGTMDNSVYLDTQTASGTVALTFPDAFSSYRNGSGSTKNVWIDYGYHTEGCIPLSTSVTVSGGNLVIQDCGGGDEVAKTSNQFNNYAVGTTFYFQINTLPSGASGNSVFRVVFSSISTLSLNPTDLNNYWYFQFSSTNTNYAYLASIKNSSDLFLCSSGCGGDISIPTTISVFIATTTYQVTMNNTVVKNGSHTFPNYPLYAYLDYYWGTLTQTKSTTLTNFGVSPETATFTSQLLNIGSAISSWGPVAISDTKTGSGAITYQFGSTNTANVNNISNYASVTNGGTPSAIINPYAAFKALLSNSNATDTASLSKFVTTWTEGSSPANVAWTWDRRYWCAVTTNTANGTYLDWILVYQRNKTFTTLKGLNAASFVRWRDNLYFGDSSGNTGLVYLFDTGNTDNNTAITSIIKTKSYNIDLPYRDKDFRKMYTGYLGSNGYSGNYSITYDIDRSGNAYSLGSVNLNDYNGMNEAKFPFPLNTNANQGREVQYTLTKSGGDRLKLYEFRTMYYLKETR